MTNVNIRKYKNKDFKDVISLLKTNFEINDSIKKIEKSKTSFSIVAILNKEIVGYIKIDKLINIGKNCYYYYLNYICVNPKYQNQNIGTSMIKYVLNYAKKNNINYIELTSNPSRKAANHLYLKNGFNIKETNVFNIYL